ncbi:tyrosine-type recombinase/integrase [Pseudonocardia alni]|uniref:tyrosine-type recombinase/integrase n=1 Tax=Pseudonocardia alni TaxID=33907 RepID=UPI0036B77268
MSTTYDVRIWSTEIYRGTRTTSYVVRWKVAERRWKERFRTSALAESFRSDLVSASRRGEAFDTGTGRPVSASRPIEQASWLAFACDYVDMKWPAAAATYRRGISEALTAATVALLDGERGRPDAVILRSALHRWAFNTGHRDDPHRPVEIRDALAWAHRHSLPVASLAEPAVLRRVVASISTRLDGKPGAATVVNQRRRVLYNAAEFAVERGHLASNPLATIKWKAPKSSGAIDRRTVVNPVQARTLLNAVRQTRRSGEHLVAFFGLMYFAGLRPEEAANVRASNLTLPPNGGWGQVHLDEATPHAGSEWTDDGRQRDRRQLKGRARGERRTVPAPPELTDLLKQHLDAFGTGEAGRLFRGTRTPELPKITYIRAWKAARLLAFTDEVAAAPLAATPYSLRHACVSTWLNGGVPATQVAEWAGHSVEVLLKVYATCLDGQDAVARRRVIVALGHGPGA